MGVQESIQDEMKGVSINSDHGVVVPGSRKIRRSGKSNGLDQWLCKRIMAMMGNPPFSFQLWDGCECNAGVKTTYKVFLADRGALWLLVYDPEFYFGELYSSRRLIIQGDLVGFIELFYRHGHGPGHTWTELWHFLRHPPRMNSLNGSQKNIHHHYNIGNPFYALWLDTEATQYTCGYYPQADMTLEQAQVAKLHHVARKLRLQPGQTVVEAGSGWGGLARFFAKHYGVKVKAYNISHEQVVFASQKAKEMGLQDQVEYIEDDYRNIDGTFDVFVSVGMLEHVGRKQYKTLGSVVDRCLREEGMGLIHTIGRNKPGLMNSWIEKRIFPGAYPPSLKEMMDIFEPNNFSVLDVENIRLHYAKTLTHWLERFNANEDKIKEMFDADFARAWRLYLAGSLSAFTAAHLQLFQVVFSRELNNTIPWSRSHLYEQGH
ncbi:MAG TPA: class I SAM-dependent methyltransferase [Gammaproteobacteria bacterium]|nr:class I SAM-dependent methyltransferase [Gammaproteobacteria bacterium]